MNEFGLKLVENENIKRKYLMKKCETAKLALNNINCFG